MDMDIDDGLEQIRGAYLKDAEDKLYKQYLIDYGNMDSEHYTNFEDYKKKAFAPTPQKLDVAEILKEAEKIKAMDQGRR